MADLGPRRLEADCGRRTTLGGEAVGQPLHDEIVETDAELLPYGVAEGQLTLLPLRHRKGLHTLTVAATGSEGQEEQDEHGHQRHSSQAGPNPLNAQLRTLSGCLFAAANACAQGNRYYQNSH